jgi:hypothetical protein
VPSGNRVTDLRLLRKDRLHVRLAGNCWIEQQPSAERESCR